MTDVLELSNVRDSKWSQDRLLSGLTIAARAVEETAGPAGTPVMTIGENDKGYPTKDGYNVLKRVKVMRQPAQVALDLLRNAIQTVHYQVGDGTTTAILFTESLSSHMQEMWENHEVIKRIPPVAKRAVNAVIAEYLAKRVLSNPLTTSTISGETLVQLALTSADGNFEIGQPAAKAALEASATRVGNSSSPILIQAGSPRSPVVNRKDVLGFRLPYPLADSSLYPASGGIPKHNTSAGSCLITSGSFSSRHIPLLQKALNEGMQRRETIAFVASDFTEDFLQVVRASYQKADVEKNLVLISHPIKTPERLARLEDLAVYLGTTIVTEDVLNNLVTSLPSNDEEEKNRLLNKFYNEYFTGIFGSVSATSDESVFLGTESAKVRAEKRIEELNKFDNDSLTEDAKADLEERKRRLMGIQIRLTAGGQTLANISANTDSLEDSVRATESAIKFGLTEPLLMQPYRILMNDVVNNTPEFQELKENFADGEKGEILFDASVDCFLTALRETQDVIYTNCGVDGDETRKKSLEDNATYDLRAAEWSPLEERKVCAPAEGDALILRIATSLTGLLAGSGGFITSNPEDALVSDADFQGHNQEIRRVQYV